MKLGKTVHTCSADIIKSLLGNLIKAATTEPQPILRLHWVSQYELAMRAAEARLDRRPVHGRSCQPRHHRLRLLDVPGCCIHALHWRIARLRSAAVLYTSATTMAVYLESKASANHKHNTACTKYTND